MDVFQRLLVPFLRCDPRKIVSLYIHPQKKHNCLEASGVRSFWGPQLFSRFGSSGAQALDSRIWHLEVPDFGGLNSSRISAEIRREFRNSPEGK